MKLELTPAELKTVEIALNELFKSDRWTSGRKEEDIDAIAYRAQTLLNEIENHNKKNKHMKQVLETVVETPHESHETWLSKRTSKMAGIIGLLSSRLELVAMQHRLDMDYGPMTLSMYRRSAKEMRMEILDTLIRYQHDWAEMQQYDEGDYGKDMYERKVKEYTTELEALKTLAL